jgi:hypothetical protein
MPWMYKGSWRKTLRNSNRNTFVTIDISYNNLFAYGLKLKIKRHNVTSFSKLLTTNMLMVGNNGCKHYEITIKRHTNRIFGRANRLVQRLKSMDLYNF